MSSTEVITEFVVDNSSQAPAIAPWDFTEVEAIIDSWFPQTVDDSLFSEASADCRILCDEDLVQLPFSPPFIHATEDAPAVVDRINEAERFTQLPSVTSVEDPTIPQIEEQAFSQKKR